VEAEPDFETTPFEATLNSTELVAFAGLSNGLIDNNATATDAIHLNLFIKAILRSRDFGSETEPDDNHFASKSAALESLRIAEEIREF
jgi:hypothetical protein